jgi:hypothetical protein
MRRFYEYLLIEKSKSKFSLASTKLLTNFENPFWKSSSEALQWRFDPKNAYRKPSVIQKIVFRKPAMMYTGELTNVKEEKSKINQKNGREEKLDWQYLVLVSVFKESNSKFKFSLAL